MTDRRGYNHAAAIKYLGIGRRSFEALVRPHVNPVRIGNNLIFDRIELDAVLDRFSRASCRTAPRPNTMGAETGGPPLRKELSHGPQNAGHRARAKWNLVGR